MLGFGWFGKFCFYDLVMFLYFLFFCWVLNFCLDFVEIKINRSRISCIVDGVENNVVFCYDLL